MNERQRQDERVMKFVARELNYYALIYNLPLHKVSKTEKTNSIFGRCHADGTIQMTVRWANGRQVTPYGLVETMAHELAHLRYMSHSQKWAELNAKLFRDMVHDGVYRRARRIVKRKV